MGLFDFAGDLLSATVKIAITPIAIVKDVIDASAGEETNNMKGLLSSAGNDLLNSIEDLEK